jgi:hypothetical protein
MLGDDFVNCILAMLWLREVKAMSEVQPNNDVAIFGKAVTHSGADASRRTSDNDNALRHDASLVATETGE